MLQGNPTYRRWLLAVLLVVWAMATAMAQGGVSVPAGETRNYSVALHPGSNYLWQLYDAANLTTPAPSQDADFVGNSTGASVSVQWKRPGNYLITVLESDASGCNNTKAIVVAVADAPLKAQLGPDVTIGSCQRTTIDGTASQGTNLTYQLSLLDAGGELSATNSAVADFTLSSNYKGPLPAAFRVKLTITDSFGRIDSDTLAVTVDRRPVARIRVEGNHGDDGLAYLDGSLSEGNNITYRWSTTNGVLGSAPDQPLMLAKAEGSYRLVVTDLYACQSDTAVYVLNHLPVANDDFYLMEWNQTGRFDVLRNDRANPNSLIPGSVQIIIQPGLGTAVSNSDGTITYQPSVKQVGRDTFVYEVCDAADNCAKATVTVDLLEVELKLNQGFSPNGDGVNDLFVIGGLEQYPGSRLIVYNRSGQTVYKSDDYQNDWDGRSLYGLLASGERVATGVYYYVLELGQKGTIIKGFVYISH